MKTIKIQYKDVWSKTDGKEPINNSPFLDCCRKLIKEGESLETRLEVYRGEVLSLIFPNIGESAKWTILENNKQGPKLVKYKPLPEMFIKNTL